ncbi:hypothetical protein ACJX0J_029121, partial [Zea mays]
DGGALHAAASNVYQGLGFVAIFFSLFTFGIRFGPHIILINFICGQIGLIKIYHEIKTYRLTHYNLMSKMNAIMFSQGIGGLQSWVKSMHGITNGIVLASKFIWNLQNKLRRLWASIHTILNVCLDLLYPFQYLIIELPLWKIANFTILFYYASL